MPDSCPLRMYFRPMTPSPTLQRSASAHAHQIGRGGMPSRTRPDPVVADTFADASKGVAMSLQCSPRLRFLVAASAALVAFAIAGRAAAQDVHPHTPGVSGMPQGIPLYCTSLTV